MAPTHGDAWRSSGGYCTDSGGGASVQSDEGGRGGADAEREEVAARGGGCFMDNSDDASTRSEEGGWDGAGGERERGRSGGGCADGRGALLSCRGRRSDVGRGGSSGSGTAVVAAHVCRPSPSLLTP